MAERLGCRLKASHHVQSGPHPSKDRLQLNRHELVGVVSSHAMLLNTDSVKAMDCDSRYHIALRPN